MECPKTQYRWSAIRLEVYKTLIAAAFLLNNTNQYHYAHLSGLVEYFITSFFFPQKFESRYCSFPFLLLGKLDVEA